MDKIIRFLDNIKWFLITAGIFFLLVYLYIIREDVDPRLIHKAKERARKLRRENEELNRFINNPDNHPDNI